MRKLKENNINDILIENNADLVNNNLDKIFRIINQYLSANKENTVVDVDSLLDKLPFKLPKSIRKQDYLEKGKYKVIDQGKVSIGGYTNEDRIVIKTDLPLILFGDHTTAIKYVDFPFAIGADGVKLLKPKEILLPKYFYFALYGSEFKNKGYGRHYKRLRESKFIIPFAADFDKSLLFQKQVIKFIQDLVIGKCDGGQIYFHKPTEIKILILLKSLATLKIISKNSQNQLDHLASLKQQILLDAISGKLSDKWRRQNPDVEPASVLLEKIKNEKQELFKQGKIKKNKFLPSISGAEIPFELPKSWVLCRLGEIAMQTGSGSTPRGGREVYTKLGVAFIRSQNVINSELVFKDIVFISEDIHKRMINTAIQPNDILLNITGGSIGRSCIVPINFGEGNVNQHVSIIRIHNAVDNVYIHKVILSQYFQEEIIKNTTGAGRQGLQKNKMDELLIPLPPLAEQKYIVRRIEALFTKLDKLKEINTLDKEGINLLNQIVLKEVFT